MATAAASAVRVQHSEPPITVQGRLSPGALSCYDPRYSKMERKSSMEHGGTWIQLERPPTGDAVSKVIRRTAAALQLA